MGTDANPVEIVRQGLALAKEKKNDYVLIDTAGRLHIDEALMDELKQIKELADPNEILLVVDAMTGKMLSTLQIVLMNSLELLGLLLPKWMAILVGAALSIRAVTGAPIKFVGSGEN